MLSQNVMNFGLHSLFSSQKPNKVQCN